MNYIPCQGIVRTTLCGMNVLIPSRVANDHCRSIMPLSLFGMIVWAGIENDYPIDKVLNTCRLLMKRSDEELTSKIEEYCQGLLKKGFVMSKSEECLESK